MLEAQLIKRIKCQSSIVDLKLANNYPFFITVVIYSTPCL